MENYINIAGQQIKLTQEQISQLTEALGITAPTEPLSEFNQGDTVKIGNFEFSILEQLDIGTAVILKDQYGDDTEFGKNNNYDGSYVDEKCQQFAQDLADRVGWDNIVLHEVDLTSDDGLKDYGVVKRRASLLTADMYRKYVDILDTVNPKKWWWLATPHSTKRHENDSWVKCVAPSGSIYSDYYDNDDVVRPFCILKSNIFVSG